MPMAAVLGLATTITLFKAVKYGPWRLRPRDALDTVLATHGNSFRT